MELRGWPLWLALVLVGGCTAAAEDYCDDQRLCQTPYHCNLTLHICELTKDGGNLDSAFADATARADGALVDGTTYTDGKAADGGAADTSSDGLLGDLGTDKALGESCKAASECKSGFCTDNVCCNVKQCGACFSCAVSANPGSCQPVAAGPAPAGDCPGDKTCGAEKCDGKGGCAYKAPKTVCGVPSCSAGMLSEHECDSAGICQNISTSCGGHICADAKSCRKDCIDHNDCIATSACNRTKAHDTGAGVCADPKRVVIAKTTSELDTAVKNYYSTGGATTPNVIRLLGQSYGPFRAGSTVKTTIAKPLLVVGEMGARIERQSSNDPTTIVLTDDANMALQLQGVTVAEGVATPSVATGAHCEKGQLELYESTITGSTQQMLNLGLSNAMRCHVVFRRGTITLTRQPFALIGDAPGAATNLTLTNSLIVNNGVCVAFAQGQCLRGDGAPAVWKDTDPSDIFAYNTMVQNTLWSWTPEVALECNNSATVRNNIIQDNETKGGPQTSCFATPSLPAGGCLLNNNYTSANGNPCIDRGDDDPTVPRLALDHASNPRVNNGKPDLGAFER